MIIDGQTLQEDLHVQTDLCVVGSGMGASALLHELVRLPLDITVVEAGDQTISATPETEMVGRAFDMPRTRAMQLGGTINLWHGVCTPFDPMDFEVRSWIPHSGWPISRDELMPFYVRACALLGTPLHDYFEVEQLPEYIQKKVPDIAVNEILKSKVFQVLGNPRGLAQKMAVAFAEQPNVRCFTNSAAVELCPNESDRTIHELVVATTSRRKIRVQARWFVVSAGGLETPRLLLNSTGRNPCGVGNEYDVVGRFLGDHPMGNLCQIEFHKPRRADLYSDMKLGNGLIRSGLVFQDQVQQYHRLPNHTFYLRPSFKKSVDNDTEKIKKSLHSIAGGKPAPRHIWTVLKNLGVVARLVRYKKTLRVRYRYADIFFQTEQVPSPESRIVLSEKRNAFGYRMARVNWAPCRQDFESMQTSFQLVRQALRGTDLGVVHDFEDIDWNAHMTSGAHHLGTARMSRARSEGVVDVNLAVFGKENLFVCDASVFPTAGNANPSLTICALGVRLADHLKRTIGI